MNSRESEVRSSEKVGHPGSSGLRAPDSALLTVRGLTIRFPPLRGAPASIPVSGVSFEIHKGETLALVGESGSGKSLTGLSLLGLVPHPGTIDPASRITLLDQEITALTGDAIRRIRGRRIGMVFQDPGTSLTPVLTIGAQLREAITAHQSMGKAEARRRGEVLLLEAGMPDAAAGYDAYPHELSGGLRQRALIAIALAGEPELLIADEPTSALDVTVQAQILETIDRLRASRGMAVLLITHDLGIVAGRADRVLVMYAGQIVEQQGTLGLFRAPAHPYTRALLKAIPRIDAASEQLVTIPGAVPSPSDWHSGCRFHPRCGEALARCAMENPPVVPLGTGEWSRCWIPAEERR